MKDFNFYCLLEIPRNSAKFQEFFRTFKSTTSICKIYDEQDGHYFTVILRNFASILKCFSTRWIKKKNQVTGGSLRVKKEAYLGAPSSMLVVVFTTVMPSLILMSSLSASILSTNEKTLYFIQLIDSFLMQSE